MHHTALASTLHKKREAMWMKQYTGAIPALEIMREWRDCLRLKSSGNPDFCKHSISGDIEREKG